MKNNNKWYAITRWSAEDVMNAAEEQGVTLTEAQATAWLKENERGFRDYMLEYGNKFFEDTDFEAAAEKFQDVKEVQDNAPERNYKVGDNSEIRVNTPVGTLIARPSCDSYYPGIWIDLYRSDAECDMGVALIECPYAKEGQERELVTRVWGDGLEEDYTDKIVHENVDEYFRQIEEDE